MTESARDLPNRTVLRSHAVSDRVPDHFPVRATDVRDVVPAVKDNRVAGRSLAVARTTHLGCIRSATVRGGQPCGRDIVTWKPAPTTVIDSTPVGRIGEDQTLVPTQVPPA